MAKKTTKQKKREFHNFAAEFIKKYSITISVVAITLAFLGGLVGAFVDTQDEAVAVTAETVTITSINQDGDDFVVAFSPDGYTPSIDGLHTHFYFDTESESVANKLFFGSSPYILSTSSIPQGATSLCAVVADSVTTVISGSGNCLALPAVGNLTVTLGTASLSESTVSVPFTLANFTNTQGSYHTNFYFDVEGTGSASSYFGGSPYTFDLSTIPQGAAQICALVQDGSNQIVQGSNSCTNIPVVDEPDPVITITSVTRDNDTITVNFTRTDVGSFDTRFYFPGQQSSAVTFNGASPYTFNANSLPQGVNQICADNVLQGTSAGNEDCEPIPAPPAPEPTATITGIAQNGSDIEVSFTTSDFNNNINGPYTRFYFNTGTSSDANLETFGSSPYQIAVSSIPSGATQLCVIVIDQQDAIIPSSGNCFNLPGIELNPDAQITNIVQNNTNIDVTFTTTDFTNSASGPFTRFYFDNENNSVTNKEYTGSSPYSIPVSSITTNATQLCVVVVENASVLSDTGNCFDLPTITDTTGGNTGGDNTGGDTGNNGGNSGSAGGDTGNNDGTGGSDNGNTTPPFQLNSSTLRLTAAVDTSSDNYEIGEAVRMTVDGILNSDGSPASGLQCLFTITFTPIATGIPETLQVTKTTDNNGDCSLEIGTDGTISYNPFSITASAQTASVGDTTDILNGDGTGTFQVSVTGSDNQTYFTNSASFTVGDIDQGTLARTGGISAGISIGIAALVIAYITYSSSKTVDTKKTKLQ
jgi:hypothetical protein